MTSREYKELQNKVTDKMSELYRSYEKVVKTLSLHREYQRIIDITSRVKDVDERIGPAIRTKTLSEPDLVSIELNITLVRTSVSDVF